MKGDPTFGPLTVADCMRAIEASDKRFTRVFEHGTLEIEGYAPRDVDPQSPHDRDELYIIVSGSGEFVNGDARARFAPGDVLFASAGTPHRFESFGDDFFTWVVFYGPKGGA